MFNRYGGPNGMPPPNPVDQMPINSDQNMMMPRWIGVAVLSFQVPRTERPPFDGSGLNNIEDPPPDPLLRWFDIHKNLREWYSHEDGTNHPHHYTGIQFTADGNQDWLVLDPCAITRIMVRGSVEGTSVLLRRNEEVLDAPEWIETLPSGTDIYAWEEPIEFADGDLMGVAASGVVGTLYIGISERRPLVVLPQ